MFHITKNITEFDPIVFGGCLVDPILIQYWTCLFFKNSNIFTIEAIQQQFKQGLKIHLKISHLNNVYSGDGLMSLEMRAATTSP